MSLQCDCNCYNCDTRAWKRGYKSTYSYMHVTKKSTYSTTPQACSIHKAYVAGNMDMPRHHI